MVSYRNEVPHKELKTSRQIFDESMKIRRQIDDGQPRKSEDDLQRELFGPRGVLGQPDPARMVPQRKKKTRRTSTLATPLERSPPRPGILNKARGTGVFDLVWQPKGDSCRQFHAALPVQAAGFHSNI